MARKRRVRRMTMPRRRTITRYVTRARRSTRGARGFGSGKLGNILVGALAGAGSRFAGGFHPLASPAVTAGIGYFMNNATLQTIGGMQLGSMLAGGLTTGASTNTGAWY